MFDIYLSSKELSSKKIIRGLYKVYRSIVTFLNNLKFRIIEITFPENMRLIVRCERRRDIVSKSRLFDAPRRGSGESF